MRKWLGRVLVTAAVAGGVMWAAGRMGQVERGQPAVVTATATTVHTVTTVPSATASATASRTPTRRPTQAPMTATPPAWNCSGDRYSCSSFSSRRDMQSYWLACPGDPSNLDGDDDGEYCE